jgi:hypothetical protein
MAREPLPPEIEDAATDLSNEEATEADLTTDPKDYSAVGGPENEPAYGRTRAIAGEYPFNEQGGPYDRDEPSHIERGGILTHHHVTKQT